MLRRYKKVKVLLKLQKLNEQAKIPTYAKPGDAAFDIYATEEYALKPGERHTFQTGIASEFPPAYVVLLFDRSGLASKEGISRRAGVIDSGYRGEWGVVVINEGDESYTIKKGDRIAQGILFELPKVKIVEVEEFSSSVRGASGFGSTGKK